VIDTEYLRVKQVDTDAAPFTINRTQYEFNPEAYELLDEPATDAGNNPLAPGAYEAPEELPGPYDGWKVDELKAEVDRRNVDRDPTGDAYLDGSGKKADLITALTADDANQPGQ
jgi:hypothetical protein